MKKLLILLLLLLIVSVMCACKARTGASSSEPENPKGARENVIVSENPRTEENLIVSESEPDEEREQEDLKKATIAAQNFLEAAQTGSKEKMQPFVDYTKLLRITQEQNAEWQFSQILPHMTWEIVSSQIDGGTVTVSAKISNVDMGVILPLWFKDVMQMEYDNALSASPLDRDGLEVKIKDMFGSMLDEQSNGRIEELVDIQLQKDAGEWKVQSNDELGDVLLGRYFRAYAGMAGNMMGGAAEQADPILD